MFLIIYDVVKKIDDIFWPMGNVEEILMELYDCLSLKVTKRTIHEELLSHPNNSSLLAISDILSFWGGWKPINANRWKQKKYKGITWFVCSSDLQ